MLNIIQGVFEINRSSNDKMYKIYPHTHTHTHTHIYIPTLVGFPGGSEVKASACKAGDMGSVPGSGRSPGEGNGNPLQYSCLENPIDRGPWWATVHGVAKSQTRLSDFTFTFIPTHLSACNDSILKFLF